MLPFKKIIVPIDFSFGVSRALEAAVGLRQRSRVPEEASDRSPGRIVLCNIVEPLNVVPFYPGFDVGDYPARAADVAKQELVRLAQQALPFLGDVGALVRLGRPADGILEIADEERADLIVMGTHGRRGVRRMLIGSVAEEVLRRSRCPVLIVREGDERAVPSREEDCLPIGTVLVPTDFSDTAREGLRMACSIARATGAQLHVLHVVDSRSGDALEPLLGDTRPNVQTMFSEAKRDAHAAVARDLEEIGAAAAGLTVKEHVALGHPAKEIAQFSRGYGADLIVIGSRGRASFSELILGSTAERVVRLASCPVLAVHAPAPSRQDEQAPEKAAATA